MNALFQVVLGSIMFSSGVSKGRLDGASTVMFCTGKPEEATGATVEEMGTAMPNFPKEKRAKDAMPNVQIS